MTTHERPTTGDSKLQLVEEIAREISLHTDPQTMVSFFRARARELYGGENSLSLSRRGLTRPQYRITRSTQWKEDVNPWERPDLLPQQSGGTLGELLHDGTARVVRDFCCAPDDPGYEYLGDARALIALPLFDDGQAMNMVVRISQAPDGFDGVDVADALLTANMFGRATSGLLLAKKLESAYAELDFEVKRVGEIQRSLLPPHLPSIPGLDMSVVYKPAARAGGDYYDFFDLGDGRWGLLIADVSGHGTPAAVIMAMMRTILHGRCHECGTPADLLTDANQQLMDQSDRYDGNFVTACYLVYDPSDGSLVYTCAGHNPPLLVDTNNCATELDGAQSVPLGVDKRAAFELGDARINKGDTLLLYTDGITESENSDGEQYGRDRLLQCVCRDARTAEEIVHCVTANLEAFTGRCQQDDDRTLLALRAV